VTDTMLVDLFPGESHTFDVVGDLEGIELTQLTDPTVLRSLTVPLSLGGARER